MEYEGQICRAPMERAAYKLPVMVGCCYNNCRFCDLFKHLKSRVIPIEEVEADVKRVYEGGGNPRKIFLGDGSAFALQTNRLMAVLDIIHKYFPECREINMNATVSSILLKSDDELQKFASNGVKHLYIGLESGLDDVLEFMNKGNTIDQLRHAVERIRKFGMCFDAHIMTGSAGRGRGTENAQATASVLTEMEASSVTNFSMFIHHETPLYNDMLEGRFNAASEYENLLEERELITAISERLTENDNHTMKYEGFHDFIAFHVWGVLPHDREKMQIKMDNIISEYITKDDVKAIIDPDSTFEIKSVFV